MFFVIADAHASQARMSGLEEKCEQYLGRSLREGDVFIACGDMLGARSTREKKKLLGIDRDFVRYVSARPYTLYSVMGNHDRGTKLLAKEAGGSYLPDGQLVLEISDNFSFLLNGSFYHFEDGTGDALDLLALGGASGHFKHSGRKDKFDIRKYIAHYYRMCFEEGVPEHLDLIVSHDSPDVFLGPWPVKLFYGSNNSNKALDELAQLVPPYNYWFFGHHHADFSFAENTRCLYRKVAVVEGGQVIAVI